MAAVSRIVRYGLLLACVLAAGLFIYAGVVKAISPAQFLADIEGYRLLPQILAIAVAFYLPWLEILCGLALLTRHFRRGALTALISLLIIFVVALVSAWLRGLDISCGCFGDSVDHASYTWLILRDILILSLLIVIAVGHAHVRHVSHQGKVANEYRPARSASPSEARAAGA